MGDRSLTFFLYPIHPSHPFKMPDISGLNGGVVKATPDATDLLPIQEVGGLTKPVSIASVATAAAALVPIATPSVAGRMSAADKTKLDGLSGGGSGATGATGSGTGTGGSSPWITKTGNYTALPGDKLRLDAAAGDVVISLPASPTATDADILFQRLDLGTNKVLLRTGANKFNTQANQDAVFAPATINLIEGVSYINSAIGWLNQHNRLSFQSYTAPATTATANTVLSLNFEGANNSTTFTDISAFNRVGTASGNAKLTNINPISGSSSGLFDGTSGTYLSFPNSSGFALGAGDFSVSFKVKTTQGAGYKGLISRIPNPGGFGMSGSWVIYINTGIIQIFASDYSGGSPLVTSTAAINDGLAHKVEFRRIGTNISLLIDDVSVASVTSSVTIVDNGSPLYIGTDRNNGVTGGEYNGLIDDLIITKG